jgi:biotin carboxylase
LKKLAIIGASYLQLPLVEKAKSMGIETYCFAWEDGAICKGVADYFYPISVVDKEQILAICKEVSIDGITSIASDVAVPTMCYVAEEMKLIGNPNKYHLVDKYLMRQSFDAFAISSPQYTLANDDYLNKKLRFPVIVKPTDRSGSLGVKKVERLIDLQDAVERAKAESFTKQAIVEEFVGGTEVSVETISWQGNHYVLAVTDKVTTEDPYFVELEHHQPSQHTNVILEKIIAETKKALSALQINYGASHTELKITDDGSIYIIEVGARMGGDFIGSHLVELSTGYDFVKGVIDVALGRFDIPVITKHKHSGVYFLCQESKYVLPIIQEAKNYSEIVASEITNDHLYDIQCSANRSGYFIYQSEHKMLIH